MADPDLSAVSSRVEKLAGDMRALLARIEALESRMGPLADEKRSDNSREPAPVLPSDGLKLPEPFLPGFNRSRYLSGLAAICFLLVVALILRTLTDNQIIVRGTGSLLGIIYAILLMGWGWRELSRSGPYPLVFTLCGTFLMFAILLETTVRYETLPSPLAYGLLLATLVGMSLLGIRYRLATQVILTVLGAIAAGFFMVQKGPQFPWLAVILLAANVVAFYAAHDSRCAWIRWLAFAGTALFWQAWISRIRFHAMDNEGLVMDLGLPWLGPLLVTTGIVLAVMTPLCSTALRGQFRVFDWVLPTLNVLMICGMTFQLREAMDWDSRFLGGIFFVAALVHVGIGLRLFKRIPEDPASGNALIVAGVIGSMLAIPAAIRHDLADPVAWCLAALGLTVLAIRNRNLFLGWSAHAAMIVAPILGLAMPGRGGGTEDFLQKTAIYAALCAVALGSYCLIRRKERGQEPLLSSWWSRFALIPLFAGLAFLFGSFRTAAYGFFQQAGGGMHNPFHCGESVFINLGAVLFLVLGMSRRSGEWLRVGLAVGAIGALKVFAFDLFQCTGLAPVISVFSFGIAAAVGSVALGRFQRARPAISDAEKT